MKFLVASVVFIVLFSSITTERKNMFAVFTGNADSIPYVFGNFTDDYGIRYSINDSLWLQQPAIKYHILKWNREQQYFIAKNDDKNPSEAGLYTRIDYMAFNDMKPYLWGFCYTLYNAKNDSIAEHTVIADRNNPIKGCNGFPFSRMKKAD